MINILSSWMYIHTKGKNIKSFFVFNNIKSIALYGFGIIGELMYEQLQDLDITIDVVIDKDEKYTGNADPYKRTVHPDDAGNLSDSDCVIICMPSSTERYTQIMKYLNSFSSPYIFISDLLSLVYLYDIWFPESLNKNIKTLILYHSPLFILENLDKAELCLAEIKMTANQYSENPRYFSFAYKDIDEYSDEYIKQVFSQSPLIRRRRALSHSDVQSQYVNIINGTRYTPGVPDGFNQTVHFVGNCIVEGYGVDDTRTSSSYFQALLNDKNFNIRTQNHGVWGLWGYFNHEWLNILDNISFETGDCCVFIIRGMQPFDKMNSFLCPPDDVVFHDLTKDFNLAKTNELLFFDNLHWNHNGQKLVAKRAYSILSEKEWLSSTKFKGSVSIQNDTTNQKVKDSPGRFADNNLISVDSNAEFCDYKNMLLELRCDNSFVDIGSVVVNCNPFTFGHRYLIEHAAKKVQWLYVFVVEENRSFFSFNDRLDMVRKGIEDIANVTVIPSGKFIISTLTFPEYFVKNSSGEVSVDTSLDVTIFAEKIAPLLGIVKRFLGSEPNDGITHQYNETIKSILPKFGIEVIEYERACIDDNIVSASCVRKLLEQHNWEAVAKLVPPTTYEHILTLYGEK